MRRHAVTFHQVQFTESLQERRNNTRAFSHRTFEGAMHRFLASGKPVHLHRNIRIQGVGSRMIGICLQVLQEDDFRFPILTFLNQGGCLRRHDPRVARMSLIELFQMHQGHSRLIFLQSFDLFHLGIDLMTAEFDLLAATTWTKGVRIHCRTHPVRWGSNRSRPRNRRRTAWTEVGICHGGSRGRSTVEFTGRTVQETKLLSQRF